MRVGDVERAADHKRLSGTALWVTSVPSLQDLQSLGLKATNDNVPSIWYGGVNSPKPVLIRHQVDVRVAAPGVGEGVVISGTAQTALHQDASRAEVVFDDYVALVLVVVQGAVVDHMASTSPRVLERVLHKVLAFHKIAHRAVFQNAAPLEVAINVPHLFK